MPDAIPTTSDPNHPGIQLMHALIGVINASSCAHGTVLDALLSLYTQTVGQFPCCHEGAQQGLGLALAKVQKARTLHHYSEQAAQAAIERAAHGPAH